jgi:hypothetical protein
MTIFFPSLRAFFARQSDLCREQMQIASQNTLALNEKVGTLHYPASQKKKPDRHATLAMTKPKIKTKTQNQQPKPKGLANHKPS